MIPHGDRAPSLTVGSLFSGVGGMDLGLERAGMEVVWQVEVDGTCRSVLRHHWPDVDLHEDVRDVGRSNLAPVDILAGGFPCQDLSVAGRREGLAGERSGLFFEFLRVARELAPRWVLVENVPGLLSSNGGRDMGTLLWHLGEHGYWWTYRVLDAQYFGVPQRRRRVFIVGHLGGVCPPEVLLEPESVSGHPPPRREAGEGASAGPAPGLTGSGRGVERVGESRGQDPVVPFDTTQVTSATNRSRPEPGDPSHPLASGAHPPAVAYQASDYTNGEYRGVAEARPLTTSADRTRAAPIVAETLPTKYRGDPREGTDTLVAGTLQAHSERHGHAMGTGQAAESGHIVAHTLRSEGADASEDGTGRGTPLVAFQQHGSNLGPPGTLKGDGSFGSGSSFGVVETAPRRLSPRECERLMGWPDDWTRWGVTEDGETQELSDSARYRMCGNGVVAPVAEWIGKRILEAHTSKEPA